MDPALSAETADQAPDSSEAVQAETVQNAPPAQDTAESEEPDNQSAGAPIPPVDGFDPEAWHFDIHGNLIFAPPAAYENMEIHQLAMPPMHRIAHPMPPHFYHHPPLPRVFRPAGIPPFPVSHISIPPPLAWPRPDLVEMFQAQANIRPTHHKKSGGHGRNSPPLCHFFAQGRCRNGSQCHFSHEHGVQQLFGTQGHSNGATGFQNGHTEKFGSHHSRHFHHSDRNHHANCVPPSNKTCRYYAQGNCRNGSNCRFVHDASADNTTSSTPASASEPASPVESQAAGQDVPQVAAA